MKTKVLGIGVATIDYLCEVDHFPEPDEKMRAKNFKFEGGGNAANTLTALSRLGYKTKLFSRIGTDLFGKMCLDFLEKENIDTSCIQQDEHPTLFSFILVNPSAETRTIISCHKPTTVHYAFNPVHLENVSFIYADGRNIDAYAELLTQAKKQNIKIAIEAEHTGLNSHHYFPLADIVFVSRRFHREHFKSENYAKNLSEILALGPQIAVTTLGKEGAIVKTRELLIQEKAPAITPLDTTGAGDAFNAAFIYSILNNFDLQKTTQFAITYATESCKHPGPRAGLLRKEEIVN